MYISSKLLLLISTPSKNRVVVLPDLLEVIWLFDRFLKKDFEKPDVVSC